MEPTAAVILGVLGVVVMGVSLGMTAQRLFDLEGERHDASTVGHARTWVGDTSSRATAKVEEATLMPETKKAALARAKKLGYPKSTVVKASTGEHFIAPLGVTSSAGKKAYAECRTQGKCAAISHTVDKKARKKG